MFIVNGIAELAINDAMGQKHTLEELQQGDIIGQYSTLFEEAMLFDIRAKTTLRVLTLSKDFFAESSKNPFSSNYIPGLEQSIRKAEHYINNRNGGCVPVCDFTIMESRREHQDL